YDKYVLYVRKGTIKNIPEDINEFYVLKDITNVFESKIIERKNGNDVRSYSASIFHNMKETNEVIILGVFSNNKVKYSTPVGIERKNENKKEIYFSSKPQEKP